jgi:hypothetical protein
VEQAVALLLGALAILQLSTQQGPKTAICDFWDGITP